MAAGARSRSTSPSRRPVADLIAAVIDNMRENQERLRYSVLVPGRYTLVVSRTEYERIEGLVPRLQAETVRALDEELARLNRPSWIERRTGRRLGGERIPVENAELTWHVDVLPDIDGELEEEDDLLVYSELRLPGEPELGVGERTRRITTTHAGPSRRVGQSVAATAVAATPDSPTAATSPVSAPSVTPVRAVPHSTPFARLVYTDARGSHVFELVKDSTTIGRGGALYPVDVRLGASEDVSREHARIRRDPVTGSCYLIDLSSLGTTLDGRPVPRGYEVSDGTRRETGVETELPSRARLGLAGVITIEFERIPG